MIKKLGFLILGGLLGVAVMLIMRPSQKPADSATSGTNAEAPVAPQFDLDPLYDHLMEEMRGKPNEKYWFDQRVENLDLENKDRIKQQQSKGDADAKLFEQFSKPEKPAKN